MKWFDGQCNESKELFAIGYTPIFGSLTSVHQYLRYGWASDWNENNYCPGQVLSHPSAINFASDRTCRDLNVILVTDGEHTSSCGGAPADAAAALYNTGVTIQGQAVNVRTHVIGFALGSANFNPIADMGDDGLDNNSRDATRAANEVELAQALSSIISGAVRAGDVQQPGRQLQRVHGRGVEGLLQPEQDASDGRAADDGREHRPVLQRRAGHVYSELRGSISASNPTGNQWWLPCWDPAANNTNPHLQVGLFGSWRGV